jgi:hypothetical protein
MTLPGFTAEASLRRADAQHRMSGIPTEITDNRQVIPQLGCRRMGTLVSLDDGSVEAYICCYGPWFGQYCYTQPVK